jgi:hypothetical protein
MFRIDSDGSVAGHFSDGDPSTGRPGTKVSADWLTALQEEICYVIEQNGLMLDKGSTTQLWSGIAGIIAQLVLHAPNTFTAMQSFSASGTAVNATAGGTGVLGTGGNYGVSGQAIAAGGIGGVFGGGANRGAIQLPAKAAPSAPQDGDIWVESGTNALKVRINGVTKTVTLT